MARGFRFIAKGWLASIVTFLLIFAVGACRKRANSNNANSHSLTTASNPEEARRNAQTLVDQAKELYKNDQEQRAVQVLEQAIRLDSNNAEAHLRLGMSYAALDRKVESDDEYKKAIELFKKKVDADPK
ncbi:MAG TPA: tetratricopeptide repeat protein, partial [Pyrinomonadaceae bacterium]|nr:tetratricopeptide repeat protein [Pyrinomonadaceae bacterium]